jgi:3-oxoacyl-[acyl-carrier protein] reductase
MKTIVVTGGASGIGREVALTAAQKGHTVIIGDRDVAGAQAVEKEIASRGGSATAFEVDVADRKSVDGFYEGVDIAHPVIDTLVTAAGITFGARLLDLTLEQWQRTIDINLTGTFLCVQAAARRMVPRGSGSIVTFASITALSGTATRTAYAASKGGIVSMTKTLAIELGQHGVRVNCLIPGNIETPLTAAQHTGVGAAIPKAYLARTPLGRYGRPSEVAMAALFLSGEEASYVNGELLRVDGGYTSTGMMF